MSSSELLGTQAAKQTPSPYKRGGRLFGRLVCFLPPCCAVAAHRYIPSLPPLLHRHPDRKRSACIKKKQAKYYGDGGERRKFTGKKKRKEQTTSWTSLTCRCSYCNHNNKYGPSKSQKKRPFLLPSFFSPADQRACHERFRLIYLPRQWRNKKHCTFVGLVRLV